MEEGPSPFPPARGYWHQRADDRLGDSHPVCNQKPLVDKDKNENPRIPPADALLVLTYMHYYWSPWGKYVPGMSVLPYPRFLLSVFFIIVQCYCVYYAPPLIGGALSDDAV